MEKEINDLLLKMQSGEFCIGETSNKIIELFKYNYSNKIKSIELDKVIASDFCKYSVIEYKLETLYKNQEKILNAIKIIALK